MPEDSIDAKSKGKHRKLTCAGCRRRKSKCDGKSPKCTTCIAYKDECVYDKAPSLAYVRSLEDEVIELKNQLKAAKTQAWLSKSAAAATQEEVARILPPPPPLSTSSEAFSVAPSGHSRQSSVAVNRPSSQVEWKKDISVDAHGAVTFHNSTSAVYEPAQLPPMQSPATNLSPPLFEPPTRQDDQRTKQDLVSNATKQKQLEGFAIANTAAKVNLPREVAEELLRYHWCWIHPLFVFVYRPAFTRGMTLVNNQPGATDPPYFSETLLKVMHAHCARFLNHNVYQQMGMQSELSPSQPLSASEFMHQMTHDARVCLGMETLKSSSIPTIQALLQQSAREIVFGRSSQGWLYGGMAFRMAYDMGIHLPSDKLHTIVRSLSAEDIEIRKRLFWSCYTWDKVLSLYLGRMPGFTPAVEDMPLNFMDDYSDSDLWYPYYGETPSVEMSSNPTYPPCPGHVVSCFSQLCRLCVILNDVMEHIYSSTAAGLRRDSEPSAQEARPPTESPFTRITKDLHFWWNALPAHLKIRPDQMPPLAPPIHIMSLNLLYHSTLILLNRPVLQSMQNEAAAQASRSYQSCISATAAIHDLILLQANTFGLSHISYLNAYCVYTASTIAVLRLEREMKPGDDHHAALTSVGLGFLLEVLQRSATAMPALERSNSIIRKRTNAVIERHKQQVPPTTFLPSPSSASTPMSYHANQSATITAGAPTSSYQLMPEPSHFQGPGPYGNPSPQSSHSQQPVVAPDAKSAFSTPQQMPMQWQAGVPSSAPYESPAAPDRSSYHQTPQSTSAPLSQPQIAFTDDWLPAFPGQSLPMGSEHSFGSEVDTQARMAMLGFNLDPHPRLNPGDIDWSVMEGYNLGTTNDGKFSHDPM